MTPETEIRHLRPTERRCLAEMLDIGDHWRSLASILPKPDAQEGYLLTSKNMQLLEQQKIIPNGSPTRALLDYWGTSGRKRPTLKDLLHFLVASKLYRAADYVSVNILNGPSLSCSLKEEEDDYTESPIDLDESKSIVPSDTTNPTAPDVSSLTLDESDSSRDIIAIINEVSNVKRYNFEYIKAQTKGFSTLSIHKGGSKLGEGAFGTVFLVKDANGKNLAVKALKTEYVKQFISELEVITKFSHPNLLSLLGISYGANTLCLIYEYMINGSLAERLVSAKTPPLPWQKRLQIAVETARGIKHLHDQSYIHRDIKSANILLDVNMSPKVGDFGLARFNNTGESIFDTIPAGTSPYMPPDAFYGQITPKIDSYSFGIVILELLTGQPPYEESRDEGDILTWMREILDEISEPKVIPLLDPKAGRWNVKIAMKLMDIAWKATEDDKKDRLTMFEVLTLLESL